MQNEYNFEVNTSNHLIDYGPPSQAVQSPLVGGHGDDIGQPLGGKENLRRATAAPKHQAPSTKQKCVNCAMPFQTQLCRCLIVEKEISLRP